MEQAFDCSELFTATNIHAHCRVTDNTATVQLVTPEEELYLELNIDKISNFLEQCRKAQKEGPRT
jgi:hypothetical protein